MELSDRKLQVDERKEAEKAAAMASRAGDHDDATFRSLESDVDLYGSEGE